MSVIEIDNCTLDDIACMHDELVEKAQKCLDRPSDCYRYKWFESAYHFAMVHADSMYKKNEGTEEGQIWRNFFEHLAKKKESYQQGFAPLPWCLEAKL